MQISAPVRRFQVGDCLGEFRRCSHVHSSRTGIPLPVCPTLRARPYEVSRRKLLLPLLRLPAYVCCIVQLPWQRWGIPRRILARFVISTAGVVMRRFSLRCALALAVLSGLCRNAPAQKVNDWVGRDVLPKSVNVKLHIGKRSFAWPGGKPRLKVERVQGEWLWLGEGWAASGDVVSLAEAEAFYTAEIKRQPTAFAYAHRAYARGVGETAGIVPDAEAAMRLDPRSALAYYCRAMAYLEQNRFPEGLRDLDKTISLEPRFAAAYRNRGAVHAEIHERDPKLGNLDAALADLDEAVRLDPKDASAIATRGNVHGILGNYDAAIADLSAAIGLNPTDAARFSNRGYIRYLNGDSPNALKDLDESLRIDPNSSIAYLNRSVVWLNLRNFEKAKEDASQAIRLDPKDVRGFFNYGRAAFFLDDYETAERDFSKAIELDPRHAASWRWRGRTRGMSEQYDAGLDDLNRTIELEPNTAVGYRWRAGIRAMQDDFDAALLDVNSALSLDSDNAEYYAFRGRVRWLMKQAERAFRDFDQAIRLDSNCFYAFGYRAEAHFSCGHFRESLDDCEKLLRLCPDEADALALQASVWSVAPQAEFRDGPRAVIAATRACELTEWKDYLHLRILGAAHAENGDFAAAATWETAAARLAPDDDKFQAESKSLLQLYKAGQPYRQTQFLARKPGKEFRERDAAP